MNGVISLYYYYYIFTLFIYHEKCHDELSPCVGEDRPGSSVSKNYVLLFQAGYVFHAAACGGRVVGVGVVDHPCPLRPLIDKA